MGEVDHGLFHAESLHAPVHEKEHFKVRGGGIRTDDVEINLHELAVAAPLGVFPAPHFGSVPAAEGEGQLVDVGGHEPGKGDGEIEAQRHVPIPVVLEPIHLLVGLTSPFSQEHVRVLQRGGVDGGKAREAENVLQLSEDCQPLGLLVREKIPKALEHPGLDEILHVSMSFL